MCLGLLHPPCVYDSDEISSKVRIVVELISVASGGICMYYNLNEDISIEVMHKA